MKKLPLFHRAVACFPLSAGGQFVSLRNKEDEEIAFLEDLTKLSPEDRALVEEAIRMHGFLFRITAVKAVNRQHEVRVWEVETKQGHRAFQTRMDQWPRSLDTGGYLIQDICEDLYYIEDPKDLDEASRKLLYAFTG